MNADLGMLGQHVLSAAAPVVPFVVHAAASATAFTVGLGATQLAGYACRVSCATPVLGSAVGVFGVGLASAMAGQVSLQCQRYYRGASPLAVHSIRRQDALLDAVTGIVLWKAMGGRFRSVMPSDLFAPGAMAVESLPSPGSQYASEVSRGELARLFRRDGCHHCGSRKGPVVGDHIPPNRMVWGSSKELVPPGLQKQLAKSFGFASPGRAGKVPRATTRKDANGLWAHLTRQARAALAIEPAMPKQRYYPQCKQCSGRQSGAVRAGRRTLVLHFGGPKAPYYAGIMVGLRHFTARPAPPNRHDSSRSRGATDSNGFDSFGLRLFHFFPATIGNSIGNIIKQAGSRLQAESNDRHTRTTSSMAMNLASTSNFFEPRLHLLDG